MPRVVRRRRIPAPVGEVWEVVSDPHHMPRWWPRTTRVENVRGTGEKAAWTLVFETKDRRGVRVDYRAVSSAQNERFVFEQQVEDTPFERILRSSLLELRLDPEDGATEVELAHRQQLRGLSRLGSPMVRRATGRILDEALEGLENALT